MVKVKWFEKNPRGLETTLKKRCECQNTGFEKNPRGLETINLHLA